MSNLRVVEGGEGNLEKGASNEDSFDEAISEVQETPFSVAREYIREKGTGLALYGLLTASIIGVTATIVYRLIE